MQLKDIGICIGIFGRTFSLDVEVLPRRKVLLKFEIVARRIVVGKLSLVCLFPKKVVSVR